MSMSRQFPLRSSNNPNAETAAIPDEDTSEVSNLFEQRLQAWKHAVSYLEDYIGATEKLHKSNAKEYDNVLKTVNSPLKEGDHFDGNPGGMVEMFESFRTNTQAMGNTHAETSKTIKTSVLPIFERLHSEIKTKSKELNKGVGKTSKVVEKARNTTQKHIELLGQNAASYDSVTGRVEANNDPFILHKGVTYRLNKQIQEENANRQDMLNVQNNFSTFEAHIVQTIQQGIAHFTTAVNASGGQHQAMYTNIANMAQSIRPLGEWHNFVRRNNNILIDANTPNRSLDTVGFSNQSHASTQALIQGSLERKSGLLKKYDASYYVVTPSKYLHEFKSDDFLTKDPSPEMSLYLPDCTVGAINNGNAFNVRGKDASKGSIGSKLTGTHEFAFRAHSERDAEQWIRVLRELSGVSGAMPNSTPVSPTVSRAPTMGSRVTSGQQQLSPRLEQQQFIASPQESRYEESVRDEGAVAHQQHGGGYGNMSSPTAADEYTSSSARMTAEEEYAARSGLQGRPGQY